MIQSLPSWMLDLAVVGRLVAVHWLLTATLLLLVAAFVRLRPRMSAATRHGIWLAALVLCATLPLGALLVSVDLVPSPLRPSFADRAGAALLLILDSPPRAATSAQGFARRDASAGEVPRAAGTTAGAGSGEREFGSPLRSHVFELLLAAWAAIWCLAAGRRATQFLLGWRETSALRKRIAAPRPELASRMERVVERLDGARPIAVGELGDEASSLRALRSASAREARASSCPAAGSRRPPRMIRTSRSFTRRRTACAATGLRCFCSDSPPAFSRSIPSPPRRSGSSRSSARPPATTWCCAPGSPCAATETACCARPKIECVHASSSPPTSTHRADSQGEFTP